MGHTVRRCRHWHCVRANGNGLYISRSPRALPIGHTIRDAVASPSSFDGNGKCKRNSSSANNFGPVDSEWFYVFCAGMCRGFFT